MPRTRSSCLLLFAAATLLALGCSPNLEVPGGGQVQCQSNDDCPGESVCQTALGLCVPKDALGAAPPALAGPASVSPTYGNTATTFTISFDVTAKLLRAPELWAELRDQKLSLTLDEGASSGEHYVFHYQPKAADPEGVASLFVKLVDEAGNVADGLTVGTLVVDKTPPGVIFPRVEYLPAETNPLGAAATAATVGTRIHVQVTASEPLDPASDPKLTATNGVDTLAFTATKVTEDGAEFEVTVPAGASDSPAVYVPSLSGWKDAAGNVSSASTFSDPQLVVLTAPPSLVVDQSQVEYLRSPWGNDAEEALPSGFTLPAGPYFALAPPDAIGGPATLPAGTFQTPDGGAPVRVRIWADDQRESLLGTLTANADGSWPRLRLAPLDVAAVYATAIDRAGNESGGTPENPAVRLTHAEWVATPRPQAFGISPHKLIPLPEAGKMIVPPPDPDAVGPSEAAGADGTSLLQRAEVAWRLLASNRPGPGARQGPAMAYDDRDGCVYLFGGAVAGEKRDDFWKWDGVEWTELEHSGTWPSPRVTAAMTYDGIHDRLVLFGGVGDDDSVWEWDGAHWTAIARSGAWPSPRAFTAMVYDSRRGKVVLFGDDIRLAPDLQDASVWEWDGASWVEHPGDASTPVGRSSPGLAYDRSRGRVVMFGGLNWNGACPAASGFCQDTWEWDGSTWNQAAPSAQPSARGFSQMAYDPARQRVVLFGGVLDFGSGASAGDVWEWDGVTWTDRTPLSGPAPSARGLHGLVYDSVREGAVLFGDSQSVDADVWEWDGTSWRDRPANPVYPTAVTGYAMAYDSQRHRVVLFGGGDSSGSNLDELWEFDGTTWLNRTPATRPASWPSARNSSSMAYDALRQRIVMFGGQLGSPAANDVWEWDGNVWANRTPASGSQPGTKSGDPMVFDGTAVVLFSSYGADTPVVWSWDGSAWTQRWGSGSVGVHPPRRDSASAAYDPNRGVTVFYGSGFEYSASDALWEWNGTSWTQMSPSGPAPIPRVGAAMAFDPNRGQVLLYGGSPASNQWYADLWAWDGARWTDLTAAGRSPVERASPKVVFEPDSGQLLLHGGTADPLGTPETWRIDEGASRQPGLQFTVHGREARLGAVTGVRARAWCGGTSFAPASADGATLFAWDTAVGTGQPVGWAPVGSSTASAADAPPYLAGPGAVIDWKADPTAAQRYLLPGNELNFQCRSAGESANGGPEARLAMDYIEARVQYLTQ